MPAIPGQRTGPASPRFTCPLGTAVRVHAIQGGTAAGLSELRAHACCAARRHRALQGCQHGGRCQACALLGCSGPGSPQHKGEHSCQHGAAVVRSAQLSLCGLQVPGLRPRWVLPHGLTRLLWHQLGQVHGRRSRLLSINTLGGSWPRVLQYSGFWLVQHVLGFNQRYLRRVCYAVVYYTYNSQEYNSQECILRAVP